MVPRSLPALEPYGDVRAGEPLRRPDRGLCEVASCERPQHAQGRCRAHLERLRIHGDDRPNQPLREVTRQGWVSHGYRYVPVPPEQQHLSDGAPSIAEHRLVIATQLGRALSPHENVHHKNGDRSDNRPSNLELWSSRQPSGQRVVDKLAWARALLATYDPDALRAGGPAAPTGSDAQRPADPEGQQAADVPPMGFEPTLPP